MPMFYREFVGTRAGSRMEAEAGSYRSSAVVDGSDDTWLDGADLALI